MIPDNCIEIFKKKFNDEYPCISQLHVNTDVLKLFLKKYEYLWYTSIGKTIKEAVLIYDITGILLYYKMVENDNVIFYFLSSIDKKNVVEYTVHNILNKQNK